VTVVLLVMFFRFARYTLGDKLRATLKGPRRINFARLDHIVATCSATCSVKIGTSTSLRRASSSCRESVV